MSWFLLTSWSTIRRNQLNSHLVYKLNCKLLNGEFGLASAYYYNNFETIFCWTIIWINEKKIVFLRKCQHIYFYYNNFKTIFFRIIMWTNEIIKIAFSLLTKWILKLISKWRRHFSKMCFLYDVIKYNVDTISL
jgi:hypothetical protein